MFRRIDWLNSPVMQLQLESADLQPHNGLGRTFRETRLRPVHRWYSYVEGFSADYIAAALDSVAATTSSIYDPFGGTGTALVEASCRGLKSFYAEANPFMAFVIDTKVNAGLWAARHRGRARRALQQYREEILGPAFAENAQGADVPKYVSAFGGRDFFESVHLAQLVHALDLARRLGTGEPMVGKLATLACASHIVAASNMTRRADLRRRKPGEYKNRCVDVAGGVADAINAILADLETISLDRAGAQQVAADCRDLPDSYREQFDVAITSPPYLNGTNYIRNTKLELVLLGFVSATAELGGLRDAGVRGGITQASTSRGAGHSVPAVEDVAAELDSCAADKRIPHMVRAYFSDMREVLVSVYESLTPGGQFFLDIGDSKFYGVHVPTDRLLADVARSVGFEVERHAIIARRHSRDRTPLIQADLHLRK
jgi:hypothetical protein